MYLTRGSNPALVDTTVVNLASINLHNSVNKLATVPSTIPVRASQELGVFFFFLSYSFSFNSVNKLATVPNTIPVRATQELGAFFVCYFFVF